MQTLGLSDSTPRTEGRLKSLFWPSITSDVDVDYLTTQGFWICFIVCCFNLVGSVLAGAVVAGALESLFYFIGGVGVRERSRVAAAAVLAAYVLDGVVLQKFSGNGLGIGRILFTALLLSNLRAIWMAARWRESGEPDVSPERMAASFADNISDRMPAFLWPK